MVSKCKLFTKIQDMNCHFKKSNVIAIFCNINVISTFITFYLYLKLKQPKTCACTCSLCSTRFGQNGNLKLSTIQVPLLEQSSPYQYRIGSTGTRKPRAPPLDIIPPML